MYHTTQNELLATEFVIPNDGWGSGDNWTHPPGDVPGGSPRDPPVPDGFDRGLFVDPYDQPLVSITSGTKEPHSELTATPLHNA